MLVQLFQENSRQNNYSLVPKSPPCILVGYLIFPVVDLAAETHLVAELVAVISDQKLFLVIRHFVI